MKALGHWILVGFARLNWALALATCASVTRGAGLESAFTYQGYLAEDGQPVEGLHDFRFILYDAEFGGAQVGSIVTNLSVAVTQGVFASEIDFGLSPFVGEARWLELAVRSSGAGGGFTALAPRVALRAVPYAQYAVQAASAALAEDALTAGSARQVDWGNLVGVPAGFADGQDNDTLYTAGGGLVLEDTVFSVGNESVGTAQLADASVTASKLADGAVGASALASGGVRPIHLDPTGVQPGQTLWFDGSAVGWTNVTWTSLRGIPAGFADEQDDDTQYAAGPGLTLTDNTFAVQFGTNGTAETAARSDHTHPPGDADTLDGLDSTEFAAAGHGHALSDLDGLLRDDQLSANVALLDAAQVFSGSNEFVGVCILTNADNRIGGVFAGDGSALTNLQGAVVVPGSLPGSALADGAISGAKLAPGAVGTDQIALAAVTTDRIAPGAIDAASLAEAAVDGDKIADGSVAPVDLDVESFATVFWRATGNSGTEEGVHFVGTLDDRPLEFRANGRRALRLAAGALDTVSVVAGAPGNFIDLAVLGGTISGGGAPDYLGLPHTNRVGGDFSSIGGGSQNSIGTDAQWSTIPGGHGNQVASGAQWSNIGGGDRNQIQTDADFATVGGGQTNVIGALTTGCSIGGGAANLIESNATFAVIGGGEQNRIGTNGHHAVIPGGRLNAALAAYTFAAGHRARAAHEGAFVWGDATDAELSSTATNEFTVRSTGGARFLTGTDPESGVALAPGGGSWETLSDREAKENIQPVDPQSVLERVVQLPVSTWNYRAQPASVRHLGPMAQDFHALFDLGTGDRHIATVDADGVALAAIQGLHAKLLDDLAARDRAIEELRAELERLRAQLGALPAGRVENANGLRGAAGGTDGRAERVPGLRATNP